MKKNYLSTLVISFILLLVLSACNPEKATSDLDGSRWELITFSESNPIEGTVITASFTAGEITGSTGCNSYFGMYATDGDAITISQLGYTEMACVFPEGVMEQEQMFISWLSNSHRFEIVDGQLTLSLVNGESLVFIKVEMEQ